MITREEEGSGSRGKRRPLIRVRDLVKRFGTTTVLDVVDFDIRRGETVVVIGGSGSGKTTLARLLIGLDAPTLGAIFLEGVDLTKLQGHRLTEARRRFAMVFQRAALLDSMTVFDNVAFPLREETDLDEGSIRNRVLARLAELKLEDSVEKLPAQLSGGMAKRVGIARALVSEPEIVIYDEPTSGLDPISSRAVDHIIETMREEHLVTTVVITHDMVSAYTIADRVILLANGKVAADGPPERIFYSHCDQIHDFAISSGVDLDRLTLRGSRLPAAAIEAAWLVRHQASGEAPKAWYQWLSRYGADLRHRRNAV